MTKKSPEMTRILDAFSEHVFGRTFTDCGNRSICVMCGEEALEFKDELSKKEYSISKMCQKCQDSFFG
jgi:uncharacterized CHY-type Zn-finger protein